MTTSARAGAASADPGLVDRLVQLSFVLQTALGRIAEEHGLSLTQVRMLAVLEDREIGMRQLADMLELEKSSVTGLVDRAERRDLVRRLPVPGNRRAVHVTVTPAGRSLVQAVRTAVRATISDLTADLSTTQQDSLGRSVTSLLQRYAAAHAIPQ